MTQRNPGLETIAIRSGHRRTHEFEHSEPIFATSSFVFDNAAQAAARFSGDEPGNIYSRFTNPTTRAFEDRLAAMEGGEACVATASGMAAITSMCLALLQTGDHIVSSRSIFGTTTTLFEKYLPRFGINTSFVAQTDLDDWQRAIRANTRLLFVETPSNPLAEIADLRQLAELAHQYGCLLVVDNCFCTPALQRPLALGADLVVHSVTKYLDGQGRIVGGAVVGPESLIREDLFGVLRTTGPTMSPFNAWVALKGLETLSLRMAAHSKQALLLAQSDSRLLQFPAQLPRNGHHLVGMFGWQYWFQVACRLGLQMCFGRTVFNNWVRAKPHRSATSFPLSHSCFPILC